MKQYNHQFGEGTAVVLRLATKWANSGRCVIADSAFASVKCLVAVTSHLGLFFGGMVKTAHTHFPKAYLQQWFLGEDAAHQADPELHPRGAWITLQSTFRNCKPDSRDETNYPIYAVGWADKKLKTVVANFGTSNRDAKDSERTRSKKIVDPDTGLHETIDFIKRIKRPDFIKQFFAAFPAIDVADHYRQGVLELERSWNTRRWWIRLFTTILGVIFCNTFFAWRLTSPNEIFLDFLGKLAYELVNNPYVPSGPLLRRRDDDVEDSDAQQQIHQIFPLHSLTQYQQLGSPQSDNPNARARRKCRCCAAKEGVQRPCSFYCRTCSRPAEGYIYSVCGPSTGRDCIHEHVKLL